MAAAVSTLVIGLSWHGLRGFLAWPAPLAVESQHTCMPGHAIHGVCGRNMR
jgi:hypothetical protein